ncbi:MAG: hypothetical protein J6386_20435 [Candidatus Synoicihabitans palmerolidicus]|nr:hypothetical protein [Candidatus Synoicihabitans palmerolidicus]
MNHELRTPLNSVIGFATILDRSPLNGSQRDWVSSMRTSAEQLLGLISDVLDFSRIEAGRLELELSNFELRRVTEQALEHFPAPPLKNRSRSISNSSPTNNPPGFSATPCVYAKFSPISSVTPSNSPPPVSFALSLRRRQRPMEFRRGGHRPRHPARATQCPFQPLQPTRQLLHSRARRRWPRSRHQP